MGINGMMPAMLEQRIQQHFIDSADLQYQTAQDLGKPIADAVSRAVSTLYALVSRTQPGQRDLPLVACRDQIEAPAQMFTAQPVSEKAAR